MGAEGARPTPDRAHGSSLLDRCRTGDQAAWERLLNRYERLVFSIPLNYGLDRERAADVMQSTFTELLANLDTVRDGDRLGAWLATVARRLTWRAIERGARDQQAAELADRLEPLGDFIDAWNQRNWVVEAVLALDGPCRDLLEAMYLDPSRPSYDEIADRLGRSRGGLGPARGRCLDKLREQLRRLDEHV